MTRTAIYPGSFDPLTNGHVDMLKAAFALCDRLIVAIGINPGKTPMFGADERMGMIRVVGEPLARAAGVTLEVHTFENLVTHYALQAGASILIRGLRDGTDLDYEMQMAGMNKVMTPQLQTVFLPASPEDRHITATLVRQVAAMGGDASAFVPPLVAEKLQQKFGRKRH
jgi:pantetheine-phosphate adenylyltransferase